MFQYLITTKLVPIPNSPATFSESDVVRFSDVPVRVLVRIEQFLNLQDKLLIFISQLFVIFPR